MDKLRGLSLFTGIAGIDLALEEWVSHIVKSKNIVRASSYHEWLTDYCPPHLSGQIYEPYTVHSFQKTPSTSSTVDSPAKTSLLREMEQAWKESEADCFFKLSDSRKKSLQNSCFWKMSQPLELEECLRSSKNLPIWGMTVDGHVYLPLNLEPHIYERGGFFLPTPTASEGSVHEINGAKRT